VWHYLWHKLYTLHFLINKTITIMKTNTMNAPTTADSNLQEFFVDQLKDIYWAEKKLVKTLPKLEDASTSLELKNAFRDHCEQTKEHVRRLENVFSIIGEEAISTRCPAMAGIVSEGSDIIDETDEGSAQRDVGLIFAGQKAEHYEIATYGGLVQLAKTLGYSEVATLLHQTLTEEKDADVLLTQIAEKGANYQASREPQNSW
jgi:ferritin-like metal-binding protein YciE